MSDPRRPAADAVIAAAHDAAAAIDGAIPFLHGVNAHLEFDAAKPLRNIRENAVEAIQHADAPTLAHGDSPATLTMIHRNLHDLLTKIRGEIRTLVGVRVMIPTDAGLDDFRTYGLKPAEDARDALHKAVVLATMLIDDDYRPGVDDFLATTPEAIRDEPGATPTASGTLYRHPVVPGLNVLVTSRGIPGDRGYTRDIEYRPESA